MDESEKRLPQVSIATKFVKMGQTDFDELCFDYRTSKSGGGGGPNVHWDKNDQINRFAGDESSTASPDGEFRFDYK